MLAQRMDEAPGATTKKRVLFNLVFLGSGGIERSVCNVMSGLNPVRFATRIFFHHRPHTKSQRDRIPPQTEVAWGTDEFSYNRKMLPRFFLRQLQEARDADVIVAGQEGRAALLACMAGAILRKPVVGMIHFDWGAFSREQPKRQLWGLRLLYPRMSRIVACGHDSAKAFQALVPVKPEQLVVIPNFVDGDKVRAAGEQPLPEWAEPIYQKPVVIAVGRLEHQKAFDVLIRAHARMREAGVDHHLLILGEGSLAAELKALTQSLGVESSVFMPGFTPNPHALMRRAAAFALSSRFEGLPMVMLEALALGCPIVSTDCPSGPAEVLEHGKHGKLVPTEDPQALADALGRVVSDDVYRKDLSQRSRARSEELSADRALKAWESLLSSL
ncbi:glycosyltransferase [Pyxidicoccus fallax]|uniref:Glycosyltransferase family 4 protein n=1 Tax=Pyxidicoccus fallax TaxID=394095 RepID=A0A848M0L1_9BACT|nr:glycosyltransferase [Pyxidicoccus fallax]NMO23073.1 glycosyltransferase family 4 protein [Pyxidicoccus fallax]NPC85811.1 glycosyltransferase [Pyxidicoccus fallax]